MLSIEPNQLPTEKVTLICYDISPSVDRQLPKLLPSGETIEFDPRDLTREEIDQFNRYPYTEFTVLFAVPFKEDENILKLTQIDTTAYPYKAMYQDVTYKISRIQSNVRDLKCKFIAVSAWVVR